MLIAIGILVCTALTAAVIALARELTRWCLLQLVGAGFLVVVVLAHAAERFGWFPSMGWGLPDSAGHYIDLVSACGGLILLTVGYAGRRWIRP